VDFENIFEAAGKLLRCARFQGYQSGVAIHFLSWPANSAKNAPRIYLERSIPINWGLRYSEQYKNAIKFEFESLSSLFYNGRPEKDEPCRPGLI